MPYSLWTASAAFAASFPPPASPAGAAAGERLKTRQIQPTSNTTANDANNRRMGDSRNRRGEDDRNAPHGATTAPSNLAQSANATHGWRNPSMPPSLFDRLGLDW